MRENVRNVKSSRAGRERWEFALDNRQIAAVAVGALVIVGSSFVLGMNAGSMSARKAAAPVASNSLEAFDTAHENLPTPPEPKNWEYEKLGGGRASDAATTATAQARVPPSPRPLTPRPADSPAAVASATPAATLPASSGPVASAAVPAAGASPATTDAASRPAVSEPVKPAAVTPPSPPVAKASAAVVKPPAPAPAAAAPSAMERAMAAVSGSSRASAAPKAAPGAYVIQIGASTNKSEADRIASRFASRGARVMTADVEGKRWYRVRLASKTYVDRPEAERALTRLARETGVRGFVTAAQ